ncbi:MAG TPA: hypothetical protein VMZ31_04450 [Phycisphaerae bacterium]|nr:hypothetical protein [Phycisphaerae bacterium]
MATDDALEAELSYWVGHSQAFSCAEALRFAPPELEHQSLSRVFAASERLVRISNEALGNPWYVPRVLLFRKCATLNIRLAEAKLFCLTEELLSRYLSAVLGLDHSWGLTETVRTLGEETGLLRQGVLGGFVFPFARVFSWLSRANRRIALETLRETEPRGTWCPPSHEQVMAALQEGLNRCDPVDVQIARARAKLSSARRPTLAELGHKYRLTKERIRQREHQFWEELPTAPLARRRPFIAALTLDALRTRGDVLCLLESSETILRRFVWRCAGIPEAKLAELGLVVLGHTLKDLASLTEKRVCASAIDADFLTDALYQSGRIGLSATEVRVLAAQAARQRSNSLRFTERLYIALEQIGKPAHYSEVADVHNTMWPDKVKSEANVHASLGREKHGVVWVGMKGTFALKEWGLERPTEGLYDTVAKIVRDRHRITGRPVPHSVIMFELGKHRKVFNPRSLPFALGCNAALRRAGKDTYLPAESIPEPDGDQEKRLDQVLAEFEQEASKESNRRAGER